MVRLERLHAITLEDARAEGIAEYLSEMHGDHLDPALPSGEQEDDWWRNATTLENFARMWDLFAPEGERWADNPWVWVIGSSEVNDG